MDEAALAGFEARAADAERRIAAVESRLAAGSTTASTSASSSTVDGLKQLRSLLVKAKAEQLKLEEKSAEMKAENEALRKELQQATSKAAKLQYRVEHLKDAVRLKSFTQMRIKWSHVQAVLPLSRAISSL
ncbi:hypothetical protein WJX73_005332 [Symbiochloris irregularis]|uniref:Uncharacterized protein n=1 Tax=Symbiochloris irregularis TaxID=706552 RepID=A0AAW1NY86_9CHLO